MCPTEGSQDHVNNSPALLCSCCIQNKDYRETSVAKLPLLPDGTNPELIPASPGSSLESLSIAPNPEVRPSESLEPRVSHPRFPGRALMLSLSQQEENKPNSNSKCVPGGLPLIGVIYEHLEMES